LGRGDWWCRETGGLGGGGAGIEETRGYLESGCGIMVVVVVNVVVVVGEGGLLLVLSSWWWVA